MTPTGPMEAPEAGPRHVERPPPLNRMAVAVLGLMGFFVSLYLLLYDLGFMGEIICGVGSCAEVQASPWAHLGPVPVALFGVLGYAALLGLSVAGLQPGRRSSSVIGGLLFAGALVGVLYSAWLTWLEAAVIHAWCQWCVMSAVLMVLIFVAALPELRNLRSR